MPHRIAYFLILAAVGLPTAFANGSEKPSKRVNIVIVLADDMGYGELGCYGHPRFKTPCIDRMAAEGIRMLRAYTPVPFCAPTRGSLLTGRYPPRNGLTTNPCPKEDPASRANRDHVGLPLTELTLAQVLHAAGYRTCCIGKWHLGHRHRFLPKQRGFDEYFGIPYSNDMHRVVLMKDNNVVEYPVVQATLTKRYTEYALAFIAKNKNRPFFLYLAHAMPHKPLACSEAFYKKSGAGLYGDVVAELDWSVGQILDQLRRMKLHENTLVIFTSDNGPWYGGSTGGLRGMKGRNWEGGVRVPMIAWWPGQIPAGRTSRVPVILADLFPTSLRAAGLALPKDRKLDGIDLLPVFRGKAGNRLADRVIYTFRGNRVCSVTQGDWKLYLFSPGKRKEKIWKATDKWIDPRRPDGVRILAPYEQAHPSQFPGVLTGDPVLRIGLFNLAQDRSEQHEVAMAHPEIVQRLRQLAGAFESDLANDPSRSQPVESPKAKLRH